MATSHLFLGPRAGGTEVVQGPQGKSWSSRPNRPLGEQLMDKKQGDRPQLNIGGARQAACILSVE